jgi:SSS family solute:Na+ symporter
MPKTFEFLDWFVVAVYLAGMLLVGWIYSRAKNVDEYLLGGRRMKPWAVGISYYATFMSTLTYLALPGEIAAHGPMIFAGVFTLPFVYLVVGRLMIPYIMKLKVTTAYEILERRLGISVRMLGSSLFLLLRLGWMSLIVYATSDVVVVPLLNLDKSATPWVCMAIATITVAYTSMGGLQAVVFTDVLQTFIMLGGAILSLVLVTSNLGGVEAWWPSTWLSHWDKPTLFGPEARISLSAALLAGFLERVCTAGSDQMAIQRYLATRDVSSARRMFAFSLLCDLSVSILLGTLGLALFAYFQAHPEILPHDETIITAADQLLPRYIVMVLPAGIRGLLIVGMLSAAMDSLSSGLNSSCSVVNTDWINRFRKQKLSAKADLRQAKIVSWLIGLTVVGLSSLATLVPGNLLELCYTIVNLLAGPLAVLFFMAMFVPWATPLGTWMAAIASTIVSVRIAYFHDFDLGFLWILPLSLGAGIVVGVLISLIPYGERRPMLEMTE